MFETICGLMRLVRPLTPALLLSVLLGLLGFVAVTALLLSACAGLLLLLGADVPLTLGQILGLLLSCAVLRGVLRYGEQLLGHYVAFKLLALLRQQIFEALRHQSLSRLQGQGAGQWVNVISADVELIEVFYAHTLAPVLIALLSGLILSAALGALAWPLGVVALAAYIALGVLLPVYWGRQPLAHSRSYRRQLGDLADYFLDSVRGIREVMLFDQAPARLQALAQHNDRAAQSVAAIRRQEAGLRAATEALLGLFNLAMLMCVVWLVWRGDMGFGGGLLAVVALLSAYGPVLALGNLSVSLPQTLAAAERVWSLLQNPPPGGEDTLRQKVESIDCIELTQLGFAYQAGVPVLKDIGLSVRRGEIVGIYGGSGCGKSTLLQLMMGLLEVQAGSIRINGLPLGEIDGSSLRAQMVYFTQHTYLF